MFLYLFRFRILVQCSTLIWALLLPSVGTSLYFYSANQTTESGNDKNGASSTHPNGISTIEGTLKSLEDTSNCEKTVNEFKVDEKPMAKFSASVAFSQLSIQFKSSYSNPVVIKWSVWWAIAMCGFLQVATPCSWWPREGKSNYTYRNVLSDDLGAVLLANAVECGRHQWAVSLQRRSRGRKHSIWCGWRTCCRFNWEQKIWTVRNMDSNTFHYHWRSTDAVGSDDHKPNGMLLRICAVRGILSFHDYHCKVIVLRSPIQAFTV